MATRLGTALRAAWQAATDYLSGRYISRSQRDARTQTQSSLTATSIQSALYLAASGDLSRLAEIYDLIPATDPHVRGVRRQWRAGVLSTPWEVAAVDDSPEAERVAEFVRTAVRRPDADFRQCLESLMEGELTGHGLVEVIWDERGGPVRNWAAFNPVPMRRIRLDRDTGAFRVVIDPNDPQGVPITSFPAGKFLAITVDRQDPDFSNRGVYRSILGDWFGRQNVRGWELQGLERYGLPIPIGKFKSDADRQVLNTAFGDFGAAGSLVVSSGTDVTFAVSPTSTSGAVPHEAYLEKSAQRISIAFLGSEQTVTVGTDQGSKASAGVHQLVRKDVLYATWLLLAGIVRRDLWVPFVRMNLGDAAAALTPTLEPQIDDPVDLAVTATGLQVLWQMGYPLPLPWLEKTLGVPAVAEGEGVLPPPPVGFQGLPQAPAGPFPRLAAARALKPDPNPDGAPPDLGADIRGHLLSLVKRVKTPADLRTLKAQLPTVEVPTQETQDALAASIAQAYLSGVAEVRKAREANR